MEFQQLKEKFAIVRPSATFPQGLEENDLNDSSIFRFVKFLASSPRRDGSPKAGLIIGDFGTGKTSEVVMALTMLGLDVFYRNMAFTSVEELTMMAPLRSKVPGEEDDLNKITLVEFLAQRLTDPKPFGIVFDEPFLAPPAVKSMCMELMNEGTINDMAIPGLRVCVTMSNPPGAMYGRNAGFDIAVADRLYTLDMTQTGTTSNLWKWAIASDERLGINKRDLGKFFAAYERWDSSVRRLLPPRVLQFVLLALLSGLPASGCLPRANGKIIELTDQSGAVVTDKVLDSLAAGLGQPNPRRVGDRPFEKILRASLLLGENPEFVGTHGVGKTGKVATEVKSQYAALFPGRTMRFIKFSAPTTLPENNNIPLPIDEQLVNVIADRWKTDDDIVVLGDEFWRASWLAMCQFMEITQERSLGGHKIPLRSFVILNNPREFAGLKYDVGSPSLPMMTRFWYHYDVGLTDSGWPEYLLATYSRTPEEKIIIEQILEWWQEDLTDADRVRISARTCERLVELALAGMPLTMAKAYVDGGYVPVSLSDLERRLASKPLARLSAIAKRVEYFEKALIDAASGNQVWNDERNAVYDAFQKAEMSQLQEQRDLCVRLFGLLGSDYQKNMMLQGGERQQFWAGLLVESLAYARQHARLPDQLFSTSSPDPAPSKAPAKKAPAKRTAKTASTKKVTTP